MKLLYIDEAGCPGTLPSANSEVQPILVVGGVAIDQSRLRTFTHQFIELRKRFFHSKGGSAHFLDHIRYETKGAEIRKAFRENNRKLKRTFIGYLDGLNKILIDQGAKVMARVLVKGVAKPINATAVYTSAIQDLCTTYHRYLETTDDVGVVVADPRLKYQNSSVAHSIFTMKYSAGGDRLPRLLEMPFFGHAENHAVMQTADLICSALLFPIAAYVCCHGIIQSTHVSSEYEALKKRYGATLKTLRFRYRDRLKWKGGITLSDSLGAKGAHELLG